MQIKDCLSVLIVSKDEKILTFIQALLPDESFSPLQCVNDIIQAKQRLLDHPVDLVIIDTDNEQDAEAALDVSKPGNLVLLLTPSALFDQISYKVESDGVFSLAKPLEHFAFYLMVKALCAAHYKHRKLTNQAEKLEQKMEEIRLVNRAKMLLIVQLNMTEAEAHRYIEKEAMNRCLRKKVIAENIIRTYS